MQAESPAGEASATLSGAARVLVNAGRMTARNAEDLTRQAREKKIGFVAAAVAASALPAQELAHTLSQVLSIPLVDLDAVDLQRVPRDLLEVEDAPVVRFLQKMLIDAINARASDLHFEPYENNYRVRFRVDGELREITQPPLAIKDKLASRIKVISAGHLREARAAGRPHEAQVRQTRPSTSASRRCPRCSARRS
jgi:type II secretory ATPase GspE/PulE/Tfp pilus assembly ATPase PilB-like protein